MRVRQSDLKLFGDCAMQYKLAKVERRGEQRVGSLTVLGTVFHYAAEVYDLYQDLELAKASFDKYWSVPEMLGETIDFWHRRTTYDTLRKRGLSMLESYAQLAGYKELVEAEAHFIVPIGDHELEGTIDRLYVRPGQQKVEIVDLKTAASVPEKLGYNIQFTAYCYATTQKEFWEQIERPEMFDQVKDWNRGGQWYHARTGKIWNAGNRDQQAYNRLRMAVEQMAAAVEADVYPLTISGEACGYCPFVEGICGGV